MSLLDGFDFNATENIPGMFSYEEMNPAHTQLLHDLEEASRLDNLPAVMDTVRVLRLTHARPAVLSQPGSALTLAVELQHESIVRYLLSEGVRVSPNHVRIATSINAKTLIQLFLEYNWPINQQLGWSNPPALAYAIEDPELTAWFIAHGADPNAQCGLDKTPLSAAVQYGPLSVIELLFANGGNVKNGQLLHYAIWRDLDDRVAIVKYLLEKGTPVDAVMYNNEPNSYLQREAFGLGSPLHDAAAIGDVDVLRLLIDRGADLRMRDTRGHLAYERAQANNHELAARFLLSLSA
nr:serine/threonine-protein phosphatase 6 regulatory ankyrin repeat subunit c [Quercus suber]